MIRRFRGLFVCALAGWLAVGGSLRAEPTNAAPDFKEVYDLLRGHLPGVTDETLNRLAVEGLLSQLRGQAFLADNASGALAGSASGRSLDKARVIEGNVAYLRVGRVTASLAGELTAAGHELTATNKVAGLVLDLRFADGDNYASAQAAAKELAAKGTGRPVAGPLVVLVNGETGNAAEALAAALREAGAALIIGNPTAGEKAVFKEFALRAGGQLCIATNPSSPAGVTVSRLQPDIVVPVKPDDERVFLKKPYATLAAAGDDSQSSSNSFLPFVDHISEADLVRQKMQDNGDDQASVPPRPKSAPRPVLRDPVLARAVDLIKALALLREARP